MITRHSHLRDLTHMRPANKKQCHIVTSSLIGWAHTQNDPCYCVTVWSYIYQHKILWDLWLLSWLLLVYDCIQQKPLMTNYVPLFTCCIVPRKYGKYICILTGIILCMRPANEKRFYDVTSSLIGWAHIQNNPWSISSCWDALSEKTKIPPYIMADDNLVTEEARSSTATIWS